MTWKLFNKDHQEVKANDVLTSHLDEKYCVARSIGEPPHKPSSSGRIYVRAEGGLEMAYYPTVFDCYWRDV